MKILVVGPGAIGCLVAFSLKKKKHDVWLLDKDEKRAALLNKNGITVETANGKGNIKIKVITNSKEIKKIDFIFICVKSFDTKKATQAIKHLANDNVSVVSMQNGIGNVESIQDVIESDNIMVCVTSIGSTLLAAGHVRLAGKGDSFLGRVDKEISVSMKKVRELLITAGFNTKISKDIKGLLWSKLIINVGINPVSAITGLSNGGLLDFEGSKHLMRQAVTEAVRVVKRKRIKLIYDDPLAKVESVCEATANNISSMLQDVKAKKRTEIDYLNGVIIRYAQELNINVPVNRILVDLVKTIESSYNVRSKSDA
ncbi:MAG: 2-dehydropantoate 2-reductase [Candidatus Gygaella obscura]|nr:2-dehydropantoate 2-reductase [Candidatus Gygaella obscura]